MSLISYQVVAYDWSDSHWVNRHITNHTKSNINHIGIRFFIGGTTYETFVGVRGSDNFVHARTITRKYGPEKISTPAQKLCYNKMKECISICEGYGTGSVLYGYLWWYTGKILPPPKSCTDLAYKCLKQIGLDVHERVLPNKLFKEVVSCM